MDRNLFYGSDLVYSDGSLSARRAWIEITVVAVLATLVTASLSARRAWIEIKGGLLASLSNSVALRKESVDRNRYHCDDFADFRCRSPQGERG